MAEQEILAYLKDFNFLMAKEKQELVQMILELNAISQEAKELKTELAELNKKISN